MALPFYKSLRGKSRQHIYANSSLAFYKRKSSAKYLLQNLFIYIFTRVWKIKSKPYV